MVERILTPGLRTEAQVPRAVERWSLALKRLFDIAISAVGLILLSPLFGLIAVLIKRDSPGPVFYRGARCGMGGKVFQILKFRTMYERPESHNGPRVTARGDPRVTRLGRWLRDSKLNELPQLWNVLAGEMSMVGPRPEDPQIACDWPDEVQREVLSVRPGITSPASVMFRNEEGLLNPGELMDTYLNAILPSKLRLDQLYVRHRSFLLDLDTLLWTSLVMLPRLGGYAPREERLFVGPMSRLIQRYVSWFLIDTLVMFAAIGLTGVVWRSFGPLDVGWPMAIWVAVGFSLLFSLTGALLGVNRIVWSRASTRDAFELLPAFVVGILVAVGIDLMLRRPPLLPVGMVITASGLAFAGFVVVRYRSRLFPRLRQGVLGVQERVLVVGGGEAGQFIAWWLQNGRSGDAFRIVGCVDDDLYKQDTRIYGMNVLGRRDDISRLVKQHDVGIIIFAIHNISGRERQQVMDICASTSAQIVTMPDLLAELRAAVNGNGHKEVGNGHKDGGTQYKQVIVWLDELDCAASEGDVDAVREKIRLIRAELGENQHERLS
jgi:lipopolysaccharide/colanic/teichoic acid biosynthesis glycosyltransferase